MKPTAAPTRDTFLHIKREASHGCRESRGGKPNKGGGGLTSTAANTSKELLADCLEFLYLDSVNCVKHNKIDQLFPLYSIFYILYRHTGDHGPLLRGHQGKQIPRGRNDVLE